MFFIGENVGDKPFVGIAGGLKGGMFVLEKGMELENKEYLLQGWEMVRGNVDKIKNLSLDLLNYGKPSVDLNHQLCDPNQPVREVVRLMTSRAEDGGIDLEMELSPEVEAFRFDPEAIHRCLMDIVTNALDAFETDPRKEKRVWVRTVMPAGWGVEYQVIDNGCGMDEEIRKKIFQSFFSTKGTRGTGIGLMMTKKLIDQHNGVIEVASEAGKGTTFIIRLPA